MKSFILALLMTMPAFGQALVNPYAFGAGTPPSSLNTSLVAYWKMDEASSATRVDSSGNGQDLANNSNVAQAAGKISNSADFAPADLDYLSRADSSVLSTGNIDYSFNFWIFLDDKGGNRDIIAKWGAAGQREYLIRYNNTSDRIDFLISNDGTATGATITANNFGSPPLTTWFMVTCWHDSVNNVLGIAVNDGTPDTTAYSGGSIDGTSEFDIGNRIPTSSNYWDGRVDEVGMWKKVLSAGEITELYNAASGKTCCPF